MSIGRNGTEERSGFPDFTLRPTKRQASFCPISSGVFNLPAGRAAAPSLGSLCHTKERPLRREPSR